MMKVFFMKRINQIYSLLLAAIIAVPAYAMDNQSEAAVQQESVVWYKKESTQKIASAVIIAAVVAYAIAVRMGKISSPFALCAALCGTHVAKNSVAQVIEGGSKVKNNEQAPIIPVVDQGQPEVEKSTQADSFEKPINVSPEPQTGLGAKKFLGQEEFQLPQAIKNIWKAMTQPRSDGDLVNVL